MLKTWKVASLALSVVPVLLSSLPAQAQVAPFVRGGYRYEVLSMDAYCRSQYPDGKMIGNIQVQQSGWHSPRGLVNMRCEYWGARTYSTTAGVSAEVGGEAGVVVKGSVKAGTSGSRTDNDTEEKLRAVTRFSYSYMCQSQQGTTKYILSKEKDKNNNPRFLYCGRPI
jgi:hypothetical protein